MSVNLGSNHASKFRNIQQKFEQQGNVKTNNPSSPVKITVTKVEVIQKGSLATIKNKIGEKVLLVDDLIATGGTAEASCKLIAECGGEVVECCFVIDLPDLGGRKRLEAQGHPVFALCEFEGE